MCYEIDQDLLRKLLIISINNQGTNDKVQVIKIAVNVVRKYEYMNCCKNMQEKTHQCLQERFFGANYHITQKLCRNYLKRFKFL